MAESGNVVAWRTQLAEAGHRCIAWITVLDCMTEMFAAGEELNAVNTEYFYEGGPDEERERTMDREDYRTYALRALPVVRRLAEAAEWYVRSLETVERLTRQETATEPS